ncbi:MAG: hypothetical protein ACI9KE_005674 [Polyangiales bacterium]|jgi:hypothetical protein
MSVPRRNPAHDDAWFEDACDEPSSVLRAVIPDEGRDPATHHGARREHSRWVLDADIQIDGGVSRGVTLNASTGGLRVALSRALDAGSSVDVAVVRGPVALLSRVCVVWTRPSGGAWLSGLRFAQPDPRFRDAHALAQA